MTNWLKKLSEKIFGPERTECRCCGTPIQDGGYGVMWVGAGFCKACAAELAKSI